MPSRDILFGCNLTISQNEAACVYIAKLCLIEKTLGHINYNGYELEP